MPDANNKQPIKRDFEILMSVDKNQIKKDYEETRLAMKQDERKMWLFLRIFYVIFPVFIGISFIFKLLNFSIEELGTVPMVIFLAAGVAVPFYIIYIAEKYNNRTTKNREFLKDIYAKVGLKINSQHWQNFGISLSVLSFFVTLFGENIWGLLMAILGIIFIEIQIWQDKKLQRHFNSNIERL